ncbi:glycosyltransferase [Stappia sp. GBMRC 2046]|uniref:Glycosyltransferase n=1 Tax=Stappia sediminis TaxID=2692190 RepID=A0A7X3LVD5_9HYPH|nr:glycosyltransferase family 2 protein [Stappia sediminis]MXN65831.1 glycosyltransferase [Stappia sediminis]
MLSDSVSLFSELSLPMFLAMFWHAVIFEIPRFFVSVLVVAGARCMRPPRLQGQRSHKISILLPGHNEGASLRKTVEGLREQTLGDAQMVVVDDGSTDDMATVGRQLQREGTVQCFLSTGLRGGKSAAANLGLIHTSGDIIIIADIDTSFDRDAIEQIVAPFSDPRVGAVSGNIAVRNKRASLLSRFQAIQYLQSISLGRMVTNMLDTVFIASGAFAAFRKEALVSIGGWEVGPGEDADITIKLRRAGWAVRFQPDAWALTDVPETLGALVRQRLRWNRSLIRIRVRKFRGMFNPFLPNFSLKNVLGTADILFFQALLPAGFFVYLIWLFGYYGVFAWTIILVVSMAYIIASTVSFIAAVSVAGHYGDLRLLPYVPGYALFNAYVLRAVSVYAYLDELMFRKSYQDTYVPSRVLKQADKF